MDIFDSIKVGIQKQLSIFIWHDLNSKDLTDLDEFIQQIFSNAMKNGLGLGESENNCRCAQKRRRINEKQAQGTQINQNYSPIR